MPGLLEKGIVRFGIEKITPAMLRSTGGWVAVDVAALVAVGVGYCMGGKKDEAFFALSSLTSLASCYAISSVDKTPVLVCVSAAILLYISWISRAKTEAQQAPSLPSK